MSNCRFCGSDGDNQDLLTGYHFCSNCIPELKKTSRHIYFNHFYRRIKERHGIDLSIAMYHDIISQIKDRSKHTFIDTGKVKKRKIHRVVVNGVKIFVVYRNEKGGALITALPKKTLIRGIKIK